VQWDKEVNKMETKLPKNWLIWVIGILFVMSVYPGEGTKAADQQAIIESEYGCSVDTDCPSCVGGFADIPVGALETNLTFYEELAYADCVNSRCRLSEYCLIWNCPSGSVKINATLGESPCISVKQTLLDNTIRKASDNPKLFLGVIILVVVYLLL
jgi:hypothetical protein